MITRGIISLIFLLPACGFGFAQPPKQEVQPKPTPKLDIYGDPLPDGAVARLGKARRDERVYTHIALVNDTLFAYGHDYKVLDWDLTTFKVRGKLHKESLPAEREFPRLLPASDLSPDGKMVAYASSKSTKKNAKAIISVCDTASGKILHSFDTDLPAVYTLKFSTDSKLLAWSWGQGFNVLDLDTGKILHSIYGDLERSIAFSPNGKYITAVGENRPKAGKKSDPVDLPIRLFEIKTGKEVFKWDNVDSRDLLFSPNSKLLACLDSGGGRVFDTEKGEVFAKLTARSDCYTPLAFSPDGRVLVWSNGDTILLWDVATKTEIRNFKSGQGSLVLAGRFTHDGRLLATVGEDSIILLWDMTNKVPADKKR